MSAPAAQEDERIRWPFLKPKTCLGALQKGVRPGITAAMVVEEGALLAEQKYQLTGLAAAGAIAGEVLWMLQLEKERRDREKGLER